MIDLRRHVDIYRYSGFTNLTLHCVSMVLYDEVHVAEARGLTWPSNGTFIDSIIRSPTAMWANRRCCKFVHHQVLVFHRVISYSKTKHIVKSSSDDFTLSAFPITGIFPEDFDFLRNLAYVDSGDGAELVGSQPLGGIWKVGYHYYS